MTKFIRNWEELSKVESNANYKLNIIDNCRGWILPKVETEETKKNYFEHHVCLSTHTFYGLFYKDSTKLLQKYGFDVELDNWDKNSFSEKPKLKRK